MEMLNVVLSAFVTIFSMGLFAVSLFSYRKSKNIKLLLVSIVFLVFLLKGILLSVSIFYSSSVLPSANVSFVFFDVIILLVLFVATLKR